MYDEFESLADDLERVERLFKYIEYFILPQFNAPRDRTEKGVFFHSNIGTYAWKLQAVFSAAREHNLVHKQQLQRIHQMKWLLSPLKDYIYFIIH